MIRLTSAPVASLGTKNNDLLMTFRTNRKFPQLQRTPPPELLTATLMSFHLPPQSPVSNAGPVTEATTAPTPARRSTVVATLPGRVMGTMSRRPCSSSSTRVSWSSPDLFPLPDHVHVPFSLRRLAPPQAPAARLGHGHPQG